MPARDPNDLHLDRLRRWRNREERDLSLGFMRDTFKREVAKPYKQLHAITAIWQQLVPAELAAHTRLDRISRGILHVTVASSGTLYELDRQLRSGLERQLIVNYRGPAVRRIQLRLGRIEPDGPHAPRDAAES